LEGFFVVILTNGWDQCVNAKKAAEQFPSLDLAEMEQAPIT